MKIFHQDNQIVVINKPGGLLSVPGRGPDKQDCVVSRIKKILPHCITQPTVHRLDMATSGLMVLALDAESHRNLSQQFAERQVQKKYIARLEKELAPARGKKGEITLKFRLDPDNRPYQVYDPDRGKSGTSYWRLLEISNNSTLIEFTPLTGRTHQLRLHAAHPSGLDCPIVGDSLYGQGKQGDPMLLHATFLAFFHPADNTWMEFFSPVPF